MSCEPATTVHRRYSPDYRYGRPIANSVLTLTAVDYLHSFHCR